jgi:hypothetical protein
VCARKLSAYLKKAITYTNTGDKWSKEKRICIEYGSFYNVSIRLVLTLLFCSIKNPGLIDANIMIVSLTVHDVEKLLTIGESKSVMLLL